jgi:serine/threonine-protein kinase
LDLDPGTVVANRYRITRPLGRGGMGEVFAAENIRTGRPVAVKLLRQDSKTKSTAVARFRQEARAAGQINSDHVTQVLDVEDDPEHGVVLVFELLEGESLIDRLKRTGPIPLDELHPIIDQVWMGLADAHRVGIIHRDLKPSNVFLERRPDGTTRVKILDFGISKVPKEVGGETLTEMGQSLGTFSFMPPEQIGKAKTVDHRADIYACVTLIYQSLTGQLPYSARNILVMVEMKTKTDPRTLRDALSAPVDPRLEAFVARGLQRDPDKRFQSAMDALAAWRELRPAPGGAASSGPGSNPASSGGVTGAHPSAHATGLRLGSQHNFKAVRPGGPAIIEPPGGIPRISDVVEMTTEETAATLAMPVNRLLNKPGSAAAAVAAARSGAADKPNAPPLEPRLDSAAAAAGISASPTSAGLGPAQPQQLAPNAPPQGRAPPVAGLTPRPAAIAPVGPGGTQPVMVRSSHDVKRAEDGSFEDQKNASGKLPVHPAGYYIPPAVAASLARTSQASSQTPPTGQPAVPQAYDDGQGGAEVATTVYRPNKQKGTDSVSGLTPPPAAAAQEAAAKPLAPVQKKKGGVPLVVVLLSFLVLGFLAVAGVMYLVHPR